MPGLFISLPCVCLFNTHKTPSLNLRHGLGSFTPALPPARPPERPRRRQRGPRSGRGPPFLPRGVRAGWILVGDGPLLPQAELGSFALSLKGGTRLPPVKSPPSFASPLGSITQEGGRPRGSLIRDAPQQPGRQVQAAPFPAGLVVGGAGCPRATAGFLGALVPVHNHSQRVWQERASPSCFRPHTGAATRKSHASVREPKRKNLSQERPPLKSIRWIWRKVDGLVLPAWEGRTGPHGPPSSPPEVSGEQM